MKKSLLCLLLFSCVFFLQAQVRKKSDVQKNPLDIADYFLLIPSEKYYAFEGDATDPFLNRQEYFKKHPKRTMTVDKKNAYIFLSDLSNELEFQFTMCYFIKADKSKIIAVNYFQEGGDCNSYLTKFYTYAAGKWTDVTKQVLPSISLKNFKATDKEIVPVDFIYQLPRYGTSITVKASSVCEQSSDVRGMDYMSYFEKYKKLPFKTLQLKWNKEKGVFEPGELK